jgi:hypothetical protein
MMAARPGACYGRLSIGEKVEIRVSLISSNGKSCLIPARVSIWFDTRINTRPQETGKSKNQNREQGQVIILIKRECVHNSPVNG